MSTKSATKTPAKAQKGGALAMVQVPMQEWNDIYEPEQALMAGTMFAELDKPFFKGGEMNG